MTSPTVSVPADGPLAVWSQGHSVNMVPLVSLSVQIISPYGDTSQNEQGPPLGPNLNPCEGYRFKCSHSVRYGDFTK